MSQEDEGSVLEDMDDDLSNDYDDEEDGGEPEQGPSSKKDQSSKDQKLAKSVKTEGKKQLGKSTKSQAVKKIALALLRNPYGLAITGGCCLLVCLFALILMVGFVTGVFGGKSHPQSTDPNNKEHRQEINKLVDYTNQPATSTTGSNGAVNYKKLEMPPDELDFLKNGHKSDDKIIYPDIRLVKTLNYLLEQPDIGYIHISHILYPYIWMDTNSESGNDHDQQIKKNISAHTIGMAADIDQINFVMQVCTCGDDIPIQVCWQNGCGAAAGGGVTGGVGISGGGVASGSGECGSGSASQESCQIVPPGPITEACIAEGIVDTSCYIPKSQEEIHRVIEHLLQMPTKLKDDNQKVVQLITYSQERDVDPFKDTLDKLYGKNRQPNYGLFAMPEAWDHIHISY